MQLFTGAFGSCNNPAILLEAECDDAYAGGGAGRALAEGGAAAARRMLKGAGGATYHEGDPLIWSNPTSGSFDNFGDAMRLLYIMSSADQWVTPMFVMMGATHPGQAPARNDFSPAAIFAIAWMFLGYIFAINL